MRGKKKRRKSDEQTIVSSSRIGQEGEMNEVHGWIYVTWLSCGFLFCRRWERKDRTEKERRETTSITFRNESCVRIFDRCSREINVRRCSPYVYALVIAFITITQANEKSCITNCSCAHALTHSHLCSSFPLHFDQEIVNENDANNRSALMSLSFLLRRESVCLCDEEEEEMCLYEQRRWVMVNSKIMISSSLNVSRRPTFNWGHCNVIHHHWPYRARKRECRLFSQLFLYIISRTRSAPFRASGEWDLIWYNIVFRCLQIRAGRTKRKVFTYNFFFVKLLSFLFKRDRDVQLEWPTRNRTVRLMKIPPKIDWTPRLLTRREQRKKSYNHRSRQTPSKSSFFNLSNVKVRNDRTKEKVNNDLCYKRMCVYTQHETDNPLLGFLNNGWRYPLSSPLTVFILSSSGWKKTRPLLSSSLSMLCSSQLNRWFPCFSIVIDLSWTLIWIDRPCAYSPEWRIETINCHCTNESDRNISVSLSMHMWHIKVVTVYSIEEETIGQGFAHRRWKMSERTTLHRRKDRDSNSMSVRGTEREREVGTNAFGLQRCHLEDIEKNTLNLHWLQNSPVYMKLHTQWYLKTKFLHWPWRPQRVLL